MTITALLQKFLLLCFYSTFFAPLALYCAGTGTAQTHPVCNPQLTFTKTAHAAGFNSMTLAGPTGTKIGYATYTTEKDAAAINSIAINPLCHRKKFGTQLLRALIKDCLDQGCKNITANAYPINHAQNQASTAPYQRELERIIHFFEHNGFTLYQGLTYNDTRYGARMRYGMPSLYTEKDTKSSRAGITTITTLLFDQDNNLLGNIEYHEGIQHGNSSKGLIHYLRVSPVYQRHGYGRLLLQSAVRDLCQHRQSTIQLDARPLDAGTDCSTATYQKALQDLLIFYQKNNFIVNSYKYSNNHKEIAFMTYRPTAVQAPETHSAGAGGGGH